MTVDKNENNRRRSAVALTGACAALALGTAHAATYFEPRIGFNVTYTDNVELAPKGSERDELIGQLRPGITFSHESRSLAAFLDYSAQAIYFQDAADSQVFHQGELGVQYEAVPEWLYFDLGASRTQTVIDPRQPINAGNMFQSGNLADSTSGQISPILQHKFRFVELEASYTRGFLNYSRADTVDDQTPITDLSFDDSNNSSAYFALRSADREARVTWETSYHHDRVDYDIALPFEYDQAFAELGYLIGR
ncbi:MAG TPA: hypothetical protein VG994_12600, partial [Steroidobacteraceae bacterium]|nr:hypothetical protein [Steroidobacteraceae bacterium]